MSYAFGLTHADMFHVKHDFRSFVEFPSGERLGVDTWSGCHECAARLHALGIPWLPVWIVNRGTARVSSLRMYGEPSLMGLPGRLGERAEPG